MPLAEAAFPSPSSVPTVADIPFGAEPRPIAVYYEHPQWFRPLFAELDRRGVHYEAIRADQLVFDPSTPWSGRYSLFLNRMSPSAWERGRGGSVFFTQHLLHHLEAQGVRVWNGSAAYGLDISKGSQLSLLQRLGVRVPRTKVVYRAEQLAAASDGLEFPLVVKPNIGGNGAGVVRVGSRAELEDAAASGELVSGPDGVFLLQEYHPPKDGAIVRAETLGGRLLYAIRLHLGDARSFSLCPADVGCTLDGRALAANARAADHGGNGARAEHFQPPPAAVAEIESVARAAAMDVGGVEYLVSERDGERYYYDVNALSNFIADPLNVVGFDPTARLVDALVGQLEATAAA